MTEMKAVTLLVKEDNDWDWDGDGEKEYGSAEVMKKDDLMFAAFFQ
jgi:multiple sugar transport system substrate-binding protein